MSRIIKCILARPARLTRRLPVGWQCHQRNGDRAVPGHDLLFPPRPPSIPSGPRAISPTSSPARYPGRLFSAHNFNHPDTGSGREWHGGSFAFHGGDAQTPASNLLVSATSSNPTLVPTGSILLGGTGATRTVTVATALGQTGTTLITLSVSDGSGSANTSFMLTVSPLPSITLTAPVGGSVYSAPASISLAAMVSSNGQAISEVEFYDGATLLAVDAAPPYSCVWSNVGAGQ